MSKKSSEFPTMQAMLVGAALVGLIAGTTSAQAAAVGAGASIQGAKLVGQAAMPAVASRRAGCPVPGAKLRNEVEVPVASRRAGPGIACKRSCDYPRGP